MTTAVAAMAGLHSQAFLPSGAYENQLQMHHHHNRQHQHQHQHHAAQAAQTAAASHNATSSYGFPPQAHPPYYAASPPATNPFAYSNRGFRSSHRGQGSVFSPPASEILSSSAITGQSIPASNSLPLLSSYSPQAPNLPPPNIDAAAYHAFAANFPHQPTNIQTLQRSTSLSPNSGRKSQYPSANLHPSQTHHSVYDGSPPEANPLARSISADAAASLPHTSHNIVQRLAQQNAAIREAWEAERNYLEANRRRAEEVYQEERIIMEEVREDWENEKEALLQKLDDLKTRLHRAEGENNTLRAIAQQAVQISGVVSPLPSIPGDNGAASRDPSVEGSSSHSGPIPRFAPVAMSHNNSQTSNADASIIPPGLDGASRRPHFASPPGASRTSPTSQPEHSPFAPLAPRIEPQQAAAQDPLPHDDVGVEPPIIDVQEVDPKLEGIPIRANAVQKPTFSFDTGTDVQNSTQSSPSKSPPIGNDGASDHERPEAIKRGSSKEQTLQVLAAEESRRLTMHAGHTPNHSISLLASTIDPTVVSSNATAPSGGLTPKPEPGPEKSEEQPEGEKDQNVNKGKGRAEFDLEHEADDMGHLHPKGDKPLKGPLMIKNIPAQDEIFWARLNEKLLPISQGADAVPTVVKADLEVIEDAEASSHSALLAQQQQQQQQAVKTVDPVGGGDASQDAAEGADDNVKPKRPDTSDGDIPLKLRTTTNFGKAFGVA